MRRIAVLDAPTNLGLRPPTPDVGARVAPRRPGRCATTTCWPGSAPATPAASPRPVRPGRLAARRRGVPRPRDRRLLAGPRRPHRLDHRPAASSRWSWAATARCCSARPWPCTASARPSAGGSGWSSSTGTPTSGTPATRPTSAPPPGRTWPWSPGAGRPTWPRIEGRRPYFRDIDVVVLGIRAQDEYRLDLQAAGITTRPVPALRAEGAARTAQWAHDTARRLRGLLGAHRRRRARPRR